MKTKDLAQSDRKQILMYALHGIFTSFAMQPGSFINLYLTDYLLIPVTDVAAMLFTAKLIDFSTTLFVGPVIEKSDMPGGKYVPWLKIARPLYCSSYIITFLPFNIPLAARYVFVVVGHLFARVPNAFILTAQYGALMFAGGADMDKRNKMTIAYSRPTAVSQVVTSATPFLLLISHLVGVNGVNTNI